MATEFIPKSLHVCVSYASLAVSSSAAGFLIELTAHIEPLASLYIIWGIVESATRFG